MVTLVLLSVSGSEARVLGGVSMSKMNMNPTLNDSAKEVFKEQGMPRGDAAGRWHYDESKRLSPAGPDPQHH